MMRCWIVLHTLCFLLLGAKVFAEELGYGGKLSSGDKLSAVNLSAANSSGPRRYIVDVKAVTPARQDDYYVTLLTLILNASKTQDEHIQFRFSDRQFTQWRWLAELTNDEDNGVLWTATSQQRETLLLPIRVPIFKGLIGTRVLVVRRQDLKKFARLRTLADLRKFVAGQGASWPDTTILRTNGIRTTEGVGKDQLYKMLEAKRFDYFPRGVIEIANETDFLEEHNLAVVPDVLINYPTAMYYFVNNNNNELAERIQRGWDVILANGEFDRFFYGHERVIGGLSYLHSHQRIIQLVNPELPDRFPLEKTHYWFKLPAEQNQ